MSVCVYAIVSSRAVALRGRGAAGERLRTVRRQRLAAVVGDVRRPPAPTPINLRRYERTIHALGERAPALLPARFGTCFESDEELLFVLSSRERALLSALGAVRGRVQMTVRVIGGSASRRDPPYEYRDSVGRVPPSSESPRGGPGKRYLLARAEQQKIAGFEPIRHALRQWVRDERVDKRGAVASVYHLIPRASVDRYRRAAESAAAAAGMRIVVSGPWPPYAFAGNQ